MTEVKRVLPIINSKSDLIIESIILYFQEKWNQDIYERLKKGYREMSQINLALAELGMEQDMSELDMYEARLGCEVS